MALLDDLMEFVRDNTADGSWQKPQLYQRTAKFIDDHDLGGGGGGSSDFTTAELTVDAYRYLNQLILEIPHVFEYDGNKALLGYYETNMKEADTINVLLCQGCSYCLVRLPEDARISFSGAIEYDAEGNNYFITITGNGTITIEQTK